MLAGADFLGKSHRFRKRAFMLTIVWLALLVASMYSLALLENIFRQDFYRHSVASLSWSGYSITDGISNDDLDVVSISGSWRVPKIHTTATAGHSSVWVGIGGQADKTLIQAGSAHDLVGGEERYTVWYEMLPEYAITVPHMRIHPNDVIFVSIFLVNHHADEWCIQISDLTTGQTFCQNFVYNSTRSSGEWVVERPTINNQLTSLVDFGNVTFNNCQVNVNGTSGVIGNFTASKIQMTNQQNGLLASVSPLDSGESSFTVSYVASN
jgi:hypothetical protein